MIQAEIAARLGADDRTHLETARSKAGRHGYVREALRVDLVEAALLRSHGADDAAKRSLRDVAARGEATGFHVEARAATIALDPGSHDANTSGGRLAQRLGFTQPITHRVRTALATRRLTAEQALAIDDAPYDLFLDLVERRLKIEGQRFDLKRRAGLVGVLAAMWSPPGRAVPPEEIARIAWGIDYHPLRHRSRIVMAVSRLRALLGARAITATEGGYAFALRGRWAVLEPLAPEP